MNSANPEARFVEIRSDFVGLKPGQAVKYGKDDRDIGVYIGNKIIQPCSCGVVEWYNAPVFLHYDTDGKLTLETLLTNERPKPGRIIFRSELDYIKEDDERYQNGKGILDETIRAFISSPI